MILSHIINPSISKYKNKNDRDADCKQQRQLMETISMETSEQQGVFLGKYYLKTDSLKTHLQLGSRSAFAFSKTIKQWKQNTNAKNGFYTHSLHQCQHHHTQYIEI